MKTLEAEKNFSSEIPVHHNTAVHDGTPLIVCHFKKSLRILGIILVSLFIFDSAASISAERNLRVSTKTFTSQYT